MPLTSKNCNHILKYTDVCIFFLKKTFHLRHVTFKQMRKATHMLVARNWSCFAFMKSVSRVRNILYQFHTRGNPWTKNNYCTLTSVTSMGESISMSHFSWWWWSACTPTYQLPLARCNKSSYMCTIFWKSNPEWQHFGWKTWRKETTSNI